jgi:hypothetical protein
MDPENQTPRRSYREAFLVVLIVVAVLVFAVRELTLSHAVPELSDAKTRIEVLDAEIESLVGRLERAQARRAVAETEADVRRQANQILQQEESRRQAEINRLQTELDFFRRLAGTGGSQTGLSVYQAELVPTQSRQVFQFILTLTQNIRRASVVSGRVRIDVEGTLEDRAVTLYWTQLTDGSKPEPSFRFKYFQQLEGHLTLPPGFNPTRLLVTLEVEGLRKPVSRSFDWGDLTITPGETLRAGAGQNGGSGD